MSNISVNASMVAQTVSWVEGDANSPATVSENVFGAISVNRDNFGSFIQDFEYLELNLLRWPGGTQLEDGKILVENELGEQQEVYRYDISYPELIHPSLLPDEFNPSSPLYQSSDSNPLFMEYENRPAAFSEVVRYCIENSVDLEVIIPSERYFASPSQAGVDVINFLERLYVDGGFTQGELPANISDFPSVVLDIGNERYGSEGQYAAVIVDVALAIQEFRDDHPEINFEIAIQAPLHTDQVALLVDTLAELVESDPMLEGVLGEVDIVRHHMLNRQLGSDDSTTNGANKIEDVRAKRIDDLVELIADQKGEFPQIAISAWSANSDELEEELGQDVHSGLVAASTLISLFTGIVEIGATSAAYWGVDVLPVKGNGNFNSTSISYRGEGDERIYTPAAEVLRQLSETVPGMTLLYSDDLDASRETEILNYSFVDESKLVMFISPNEIPESGSIDVTFEEFGAISHVWVERVSTLDGASSGPAVVTREVVEIQDGRISLELLQAHEVLRVIVAKENAGDDPLLLWGSDSADNLHGGNGSDQIETNGGSDFVDGKGGDDIILLGSGSDFGFGGLGNDHILGGNGDDFIDGGAGNDRLEGQKGNNVVFGHGGSDFLSGWSGRDLLLGGAGDDKHFGNGGNDVIFGGKGNDVINGGAGDDLLIGGSGSDTFIFKDDFGQDSIADFDLEDTLDLSALSEITSFDDLYERSKETSSGLEVQISNDSVISFLGAELSDIDFWDIVFV